MLTQLKAYWQSLTAAQKGVQSFALVAAVAIVAGVGWMSTGVQYTPMYTSSNPAELREVADALDAQGLSYRITNDGRTIETLYEEEGKARVASAGAGVIPGFETLDTIQLGTSPQRERWAYQRALQGELMRTIASLEEIQWARVHLVIPERSAFLRDERTASASVTVKLLPGATLSGSKIRGITALVSGAVEGLQPEDVVLTDQDGRLIAGGGESETAGSPSSMLSTRAAEENRTRSNILEALTLVLGSPHDLSVGVTVEVVTKTLDRLTRSQDPESQVLVSESIREETSANTSQGGIPGTESNLPEKANTGSGKDSQSSSMEQRSNYAYTEVEEREIQTAGDIKRLSVAVVVNADRVKEIAAAMATGAAEDAAAAQAAAATTIDSTELESHIEDTVRAAMGYDEERGDKVVVTFLPFSDDALGDEMVAPADYSTLMQVLPYVVMIVGLLVAGGVLNRFIGGVTGAGGRGGLGGSIPEMLGVGGGPDGRAQLTEDELARMEQGRTLADRLRLLVDNFEPIEADDFNRLVELQGDATAQVLKRWIRAT